jgi:hypothetical protein
MFSDVFVSMFPDIDERKQTFPIVDSQQNIAENIANKNKTLQYQILFEFSFKHFSQVGTVPALKISIQ